MITSKQIIRHYTETESGMLWGSGLYYMLGLIPKAPKCFGVLSNKVKVVSYFGDKSKTRPVDMSDENAEVKAWVMPVDFKFTPSVVRMMTAIQLLDTHLKNVKTDNLLIAKWREFVCQGVLAYNEDDFNIICSDETVFHFFNRGIEGYKRLVKKSKRFKRELNKLENKK